MPKIWTNPKVALPATNGYYETKGDHWSSVVVLYYRDGEWFGTGRLSHCRVTDVALWAMGDRWN